MGLLQLLEEDEAGESAGLLENSIWAVTGRKETLGHTALSLPPSSALSSLCDLPDPQMCHLGNGNKSVLQS